MSCRKAAASMSSDRSPRMGANSRATSDALSVRPAPGQLVSEQPTSDRPCFHHSHHQPESTTGTRSTQHAAQQRTMQTFVFHRTRALCADDISG
jgi:hypothetical protein